MSEAKADVDRNPVSPVVTSPDARTLPDESRHVTSPAKICRNCRWFIAKSGLWGYCRMSGGQPLAISSCDLWQIERPRFFDWMKKTPPPAR
jgi:hypothetical protein